MTRRSARDVGETISALRQARPEIAIDLPMRVMVRDDGQPGSLITWQDPAYLAQRYGLATSAPPGRGPAVKSAP
ncbi:hypothetical protein ACIA47_16525 [Micromonospora sp. NPDC051227]|uniref:hypothetical protein n=1 Tax=Micromonospora sp. NPDC051227 TaxID=3364285 RepID=UPI0037B442FA